MKAHFVQREEYKTAFEFLSEDKMPAPAREMMQSMLDDMNEQLASGIAASRSLPIERVKELMAGGPYTAQEALDKKLIDQIGYSDEIDKIMNDTYGKKAMMRPEEYVDLPLDMKKNPMPKETVAFIVAHGEIADRAEHYSPLSRRRDHGRP
ncbi:MAG: S49 family peptidase [Alphaproteobacteria bacterium]